MMPGHGNTIGLPVCSGLIVTLDRFGVDAALDDAPVLPGTVSLITTSRLIKRKTTSSRQAYSYYGYYEASA